MLIDLLLLMLSAVLIENFVLTRLLGCCPFLGVSEKPEIAVGMGCAVTFVMTVSSAVTYLIYTYILVPFDLLYLKTIAFILIIATLVQFVEMFLKKFIPVLYNAFGIFLPLITTNCAVLGAVLLNVEKGYDLIYSITFGFSAALGFTLAIILFSGIREKLEFADPPKAFRGIPLALIAAGLIAMAFTGFKGIAF